MYVCGTVSIAQYCGIYSPLTSADAFMAMVRRKEGKETSVGQRERKNDGSNGDITKLRKILLDSCITISFKRIIRKQFHIKLLVILHLSIIWTENNYLGSVIFHPCSSFHVTLFGRCTCKEVGRRVAVWFRRRVCQGVPLFPWDISLDTPNKLISRSEFTSFIIFTPIYVTWVTNNLNRAVI